MERDVRRDRGQWRGCYSFKDIVCDDDHGAGPKRDGGLKQGHTYYYYVSSASPFTHVMPPSDLTSSLQYEVDGSYETHDPNLPATTHCPYLPGQMVNTLEVPREQVLRQRSASLSSMRSIDFMTQNPRDKFTTPRPAPRVPDLPGQRLGTAPQPQPLSVSSDRPMSPTSSWRRLFRLRSSSRGSERGRPQEHDERYLSPEPSLEDTKSIVSHGSRSRDISPESLRRFLVEDSPTRARTPASEERPVLSIPEDIAEENEDDDNFATSAVSENNPYSTCLSPPPFKRSHSDGSMPTAANNNSQMTLTQYVTSTSDRQDRVPKSPFQARFDVGLGESRFSISSMSSAASAGLHDDETPSFYDSYDDDDVVSSADGDAYPFQPLSLPGAKKQSIDSGPEVFPGYSLPRSLDDTDKPKTELPATGSPPLIAPVDTGAPLVGHTSLLAAPGDHGIDDFVSEMTWMVDVIRGKP